MSLLERVAHIPRVGRRNEAVLIWGGLRGGVALALALALPEELPERDMFVAMTGGVVLATLLLNATTIGPLIHRLGLDRPSRPARFLAAIARLHAGRAARERLERARASADEEAAARLREVERAARDELGPHRAHAGGGGRGGHPAGPVRRAPGLPAPERRRACCSPPPPARSCTSSTTTSSRSGSATSTCAPRRGAASARRAA
jgi:hypothetical protein